MTGWSLSPRRQFKVNFSLKLLISLQHLLLRLLQSAKPWSPASVGTNLEFQQEWTPHWVPDTPEMMSRIMVHPGTIVSEKQLENLMTFRFEKGRFRGAGGTVFKPMKGMVLLRVADMSRTKVPLKGTDNGANNEEAVPRLL